MNFYFYSIIFAADPSCIHILSSNLIISVHLVTGYKSSNSGKFPSWGTVASARTNNFPPFTWLENRDSDFGLFNSKSQVLAVICLWHLVCIWKKSTMLLVASFLFFKFSPFIIYEHSGILFYIISFFSPILKQSNVLFQFQQLPLVK